MLRPEDDERSVAQRALDEQFAAEALLAPLDFPADAPVSSVESHLGRCRRPLPEHSRGIIWASEAP